MNFTKNSKSNAMLSDRQRYEIYAQRKSELFSKNLTPEQYQKEIKRIASELGL